MKLLNKIGITFFITTAILLGSYLYVPIKIGAASNMFSEEPKAIKITEIIEDSHRSLKYTDYYIKDKDDLSNFYNELKEIKVLKTLKKEKILNSYKIDMGKEYIEILLGDDFIRVNNEDFMLLEPKDNYNNLIMKIKNNFIN